MKYAKPMNEFNHKHVNVCLNYHRPCAFAQDVVDSRGKIKKKYARWTIPYEKLKSLPNAEHHLKPGITFAELDKRMKTS